MRGPAPREQLAALCRKVRNLQRRKRRLDAAGGAAEVAAPAQAPAVRLAQLVYVLADYSQATAAHFLRGWGRRRQQNGVAPADRQLADLLEDVVWATRSQTGEAVSSFSVKDQVLAGRYVVEDKLFHWVFFAEHGARGGAIALAACGASADVRPCPHVRRGARQAACPIVRQATRAAQMAGQVPGPLGGAPWRLEGSECLAHGADADEGRFACGCGSLTRSGLKGLGQGLLERS